MSETPIFNDQLVKDREPIATSDRSVVFTHLADRAGISELIKKRCYQPDRTLLVAGDQRDVWIIPVRTVDACFHCFELWRYDQKTLNQSICSARADAFKWPILSSSLQAFVETAVATYPDVDLRTKIRHCDLVARTVEDHHLLRHPLCDTCATKGAFDTDVPTADTLRAPDQPASERVLDFQQLEKVLRKRVIDVEHGVVRSLTRQNGSKIIPVASADGYSFSGPGSATWSFGRTGNCSVDWTVACLEAVERLSGTKPGRGREWTKASFEELGDRAIDPRSFILPEPPTLNETSSGFERYSPTARYEWCEGFSLKHDKPVLVPLQSAYYGLARSELVGSFFVDENSNGCALGGSILEAAFHGLLELLERDAFLRHYYADALVPALPAEAFSDPFIDGIATRIHSEGYELDFLQLATGTIAHVFAARLRHQESTCGPALAFSAGANLSAARAARAAVCEVASSIFEVSSEALEDKKRRGLQLLSSPSDVRTMEDHGLQGWPPESLATRDFRCRPSKGPIANDSEHTLSGAFQSIVSSLAEHGIDVIIVNQSHPNLVEDGLYCVKVLAPGLLPMTFGHDRKRVNRKALLRLQLDDAKTLIPEDVRPHLFQ